jgi:hypothetical protein
VACDASSVNRKATHKRATALALFGFLLALGGFLTHILTGLDTALVTLIGAVLAVIGTQWRGQAMISTTQMWGGLLSWACLQLILLLRPSWSTHWSLSWRLGLLGLIAGCCAGVAIFVWDWARNGFPRPPERKDDAPVDNGRLT